MCKQREFAADPFEFMKTNLVVVPPGLNDVITGHGQTLAEFYVEDAGDRFELRTTVGMTTPNPHPPYVMAYWCPYQKDNDCKIMVGNYADYMFTAKLDGCSFGVGSPTGHGEALVCHSNRTTQAGKGATSGLAAMKKQTQLQQKSLSKVFKRAGTGFKGLLETNPKDCATVIGVSTPWKGWTYYYQSYVGHPGFFRFNGLIEFKSAAASQ